MLQASGSLVVKIIEVASDTLHTGLRLSAWGQQEDYWVVYGDCVHSKERTSMTQESLLGHGLIIIEASRSHSDTPHSVGLLWTRDQPDAGTSTWQHTTFKKRQTYMPRRDSNTQSQDSSCCKTSLRPRGYWDLQRIDWFAELKKLKSYVSSLRERLFYLDRLTVN